MIRSDSIKEVPNVFARHSAIKYVNSVTETDQHTNLFIVLNFALILLWKLRDTSILDVLTETFHVFL